MLYHFELQMAGVILLAAMMAGGISLWLKRRREGRDPGGEGAAGFGGGDALAGPGGQDPRDGQQAPYRGT